MKLTLVALLLVPAAVAIAALRTASDGAAATVLLLTLGVLAAALLGVPRRPWVGFALFGWGYLALVWYGADELPTTMLLDGVLPQISGPWHAALDEPVLMKFPTDTPLDEVLRYVGAVSGLQIYVDPVGLLDAGRTETAPVRIDLEGVPLGESLSLTLSQLGLTYRVHYRYIVVTNDHRPEAFLRIGHCCFALVAGCLGALVGSGIEKQRRRHEP